jgi:dihydroxy-acid dehydratase
MACITEVLGFAPLGSASASAPSGARLAIGYQTGQAIVSIALAGRNPHDFLSRESFVNAAVVLGAIGGSTNAVIHLLAIARRAGVAFTLDDIDRATSTVPVVVNVKPSGSGYMDDFHADGGLPQVLHRIKDFLDLSARRADGLSLGEALAAIAPAQTTGVGITDLSSPVSGSGAIKVLRGSLAPSGAVIKTSAATESLLRHSGPAVVFDSLEDLAQRIDSDDLEVTADSVLVLRNAGPLAAGMPEAGALPIPKKLSAQGVTDMVRISDARMSGTAFGTVVLHVAPEAAAGGPLAAVRDGDTISLDARAGRLDLIVSDEEIARRLTTHNSVTSLPDSAWSRIQQALIMQANDGCDLDTTNLSGVRHD